MDSNNTENLVSNSSDNGKIIDTSNILATLNVSSTPSSNNVVNNEPVISNVSETTVNNNTSMSIPITTADSTQNNVSEVSVNSADANNVVENAATNVGDPNSLSTYMSSNDTDETTETIENNSAEDNSNDSNNENGSKSMNFVILLIGILVIGVGALFVPNLVMGNKKYTVTFMDLDGVYLVQDNLSRNSMVTEPVPPVKDGYSFLGWYLDGDLYDFTSAVKNDIYLKAKWLNNKTNVIEEVKEEKVDKDTTTTDNSSTNTKTNANSNNANTNNNNSNSSGNTNTNTGNNNKTQTPTSTPTPTPTPVNPQPTAVPTTSHKIILIDAKFSDGTTTKILKSGEKVNIYASLPNNYVDTNWTGNNSCSTAIDDGNTYYKKSHSYSLSMWNVSVYNTNLIKTSDSLWSVDNPSQTSFVYTVDSKGTKEALIQIEAYIDEEITEVEKHKCVKYDATSSEDTYTCNDGGTLDGTVCLKVIEE